MKKYILYITLLFSVNLISQELNLKGQVFEKETDILFQKPALLNLILEK